MFPKGKIIHSLIEIKTKKLKFDLFCYYLLGLIATPTATASTTATTTSAATTTTT
jgi:hypothetical protein